MLLPCLEILGEKMTLERISYAKNIAMQTLRPLIHLAYQVLERSSTDATIWAELALSAGSSSDAWGISLLAYARGVAKFLKATLHVSFQWEQEVRGKQWGRWGRAREEEAGAQEMGLNRRLGMSGGMAKGKRLPNNCWAISLKVSMENCLQEKLFLLYQQTFRDSLPLGLAGDAAPQSSCVEQRQQLFIAACQGQFGVTEFAQVQSIALFS